MEKAYNISLAMNDTKHAYLCIVSENMPEKIYTQFEKNFFTEQHYGKFELGDSTLKTLNDINPKGLVDIVNSGFFAKVVSNEISLVDSIAIIQDFAYSIITKGVQKDVVMEQKNYKVQLPALDNITLITTSDIPINTTSAQNFKEQLSAESIYATGKPEVLYHYLKNTYNVPDGMQWNDKYTVDTGKDEDFTEDFSTLLNEEKTADPKKAKEVINKLKKGSGVPPVKNNKLDTFRKAENKDE